MIIVDTCVWSEALRRNRDRDSKTNVELRRLIIEDQAAIIGAVRQELLSGIRVPALFEQLCGYLRTFPDEQMETEDHEFAAELHCRCADRGVATSPVDILLCAVAVRRDWPVFTVDRDFLLYRQVTPLKLHAWDHVQ